MLKHKKGGGIYHRVKYANEISRVTKVKVKTTTFNGVIDQIRIMMIIICRMRK